jgi:hypothetical protein
LHGREELGKDVCSYEVLKQALVERFSDKPLDQYYYTRLQEAVQGREEGAEEFSDRCRQMCQRTIRRVQEVQHVINEEAERRLLPAYINGLKGVIGQQVQIQMPSTVEQAVRLAVTIENVERLRHMKEGPSKIFTVKSEMRCYQCWELGHYARNFRRDRGPTLSDGRSWGDRRGNSLRGPNRESRANRGNRSIWAD